MVRSEAPAPDGDPAAGQPPFQVFDSACAERSTRCVATTCSIDERTVSAEDACTLSELDATREASRCFNCGCVAVTPSDLAPVIVALDGVVVTTERELSAADFFAVGPGTSTALGAGELVREVRLPSCSGERRTWYEKFRLRKSIDFPVVSAAVALRGTTGEWSPPASSSALPLRCRGACARWMRPSLGWRRGPPFLSPRQGRRPPPGHARGAPRANEYKVKIATAVIARAVEGAANDV